MQAAQYIAPPQEDQPTDTIHIDTADIPEYVRKIVAIAAFDLIVSIKHFLNSLFGCFTLFGHNAIHNIHAVELVSGTPVPAGTIVASSPK